MSDQERRHTDQEILNIKLQLQEMEGKMQSLEDKIDGLQDGVSGLIQAWNTGKGASAFLIGTAKFAGACAVVWALLRNVKWGNIFL